MAVMATVTLPGLSVNKSSRGMDDKEKKEQSSTGFRLLTPEEAEEHGKRAAWERRAAGLSSPDFDKFFPTIKDILDYDAKLKKQSSTGFRLLTPEEEEELGKRTAWERRAAGLSSPDFDKLFPTIKDILDYDAKLKEQSPTGFKLMTHKEREEEEAKKRQASGSFRLMTNKEREEEEAKRKEQGMGPVLTFTRKGVHIALDINSLNMVDN